MGTQIDCQTSQVDGNDDITDVGRRTFGSQLAPVKSFGSAKSTEDRSSDLPFNRLPPQLMNECHFKTNASDGCPPVAKRLVQVKERTRQQEVKG